MSRQVPHVEDIATGTPTAGLVPVSAGAGLAPAWGAAGAGPVALIGHIAVAVAGDPVSFDPVPNTYKHLLLVGNARASGFGVPYTALGMRFNTDSGANYAQAEKSADFASGASGNVVGNNSGATTFMAVGRIVTNLGDAGSFSSYRVLITNYANAALWKGFLSESTSMSSLASGAISRSTGGMWASLVPISRIDLLVNTNPAQFEAGTEFDLYGLS